ncbi:cbb3-type cytochrome oxidase assembly protein CcoS [Polaromonas jejuensis]|uniref:Cbb3-type cytochrome oxidase assembly protein CcoS n=1 Tax=Polaromonas jejuensis TaxID=457502 RepID=A0ABW0Q9W4_9BURK
MDVLFLLVPLSVLLALAVLGVLAWAVWSGQFEDMESEGQRIFQDEAMTSGESADLISIDPYQHAHHVPAAH